MRFKYIRKIFRVFELFIMFVVSSDAFCAWSETVVESAQITNFGIYEQGELLARPPASKTEQGYVQQFDDYHLIKGTTRIPLVKGLSFGINYRLFGTPEWGETTVTIKVFHPAIRKPGKKRISYVDE